MPHKLFQEKNTKQQKMRERKYSPFLVKKSKGREKSNEWPINFFLVKENTCRIVFRLAGCRSPPPLVSKRQSMTDFNFESIPL